MKEITYEEFCEFINKNITSDNEAQKIVRHYLLKDFQSNSNEYVKPIVEENVLINNSDNLFIPNKNIYINLKKLTVLTLACVCDIFITKGAITALGVALGKINPCIYKLEKEDCCIFAKVLFYSTISEGININSLVCEYTTDCFNNNYQRCSFYKNEGKCIIKELDIRLIINKLISNGVIKSENNIISLA
ncbi:MAG: hypothetical protein J6A94_06480 [Lachnospiraceae bacterium]|nr:hypothetical protein [Lachnospiraceae bacterium]